MSAILISLFPTFSSVQLLSRVQLFVTPWTASREASLSITNFRSLPKLMAIESVMPSNHLILCRSLLLLPSVFPRSLFSCRLLPWNYSQLLEFPTQFLTPCSTCTWCLIFNMLSRERGYSLRSFLDKQPWSNSVTLKGSSDHGTTVASGRWPKAGENSPHARARSHTRASAHTTHCSAGGRLILCTQNVGAMKIEPKLVEATRSKFQVTRNTGDRGTGCKGPWRHQQPEPGGGNHRVTDQTA